MLMGTIGQPDFSAILKLPSRNGRKVSFTLFLVPSGKIQMEMPDFTFSMPSKIVFNPCLISFAVKKKAVEIFHPGYKEGVAEHFFLGYIAGRPWHAHISEQDVKIASVVAHV